MLSLQDADFDELQSLIARVNDVNEQYQALAGAAAQQVYNIEQNFNAMMLSRTGFVFQEIKDLEYVVLNEIFDRASEVEDQVCIIIARSQLESASSTAGSSSMGAYRDVLQRLNIMQILEVYPTLSEINRAIPMYAIEPITVLRSSNAVSDMNGYLGRLTGQVRLHTDLFEGFIDQLMSEMRILENYLNRDLNAVLTASLETTRIAFLSSVADIRNSIAECV